MTGPFKRNLVYSTLLALGDQSMPRPEERLDLLGRQRHSTEHGRGFLTGQRGAIVDPGLCGKNTERLGSGFVSILEDPILPGCPPDLTHNRRPWHDHRRLWYRPVLELHEGRRGALVLELD
ncbi:hypothetical protein J8273_0178 [Carpediemonas membranifera]|uniref:Uncharacterized protein n=1 Tax=Carpediemonas membranifera TaxID=201153 RepID=A0A8J6AXK0_9EUKA|nr:hypothetical protein J8273_0178 [Carpediemonas membranifera]|eukprot:KAG9394970.1 hypothetical protein J8273_0178 [Carpediemonas membranifera]